MWVALQEASLVQETQLLFLLDKGLSCHSFYGPLKSKGQEVSENLTPGI